MLRPPEVVDKLVTFFAERGTTLSELPTVHPASQEDIPAWLEIPEEALAEYKAEEKAKAEKAAEEKAAPREKLDDLNWYGLDADEVAQSGHDDL